jgi:WD40 repeat protein
MKVQLRPVKDYFKRLDAFPIKPSPPLYSIQYIPNCNFFCIQYLHGGIAFYSKDLNYLAGQKLPLRSTFCISPDGEYLFIKRPSAFEILRVKDQMQCGFEKCSTNSKELKFFQFQDLMILITDTCLKLYPKEKFQFTKTIKINRGNISTFEVSFSKNRIYSISNVCIVQIFTLNTMESIGENIFSKENLVKSLMLKNEMILLCDENKMYLTEEDTLISEFDTYDFCGSTITSLVETDDYLISSFKNKSILIQDLLTLSVISFFKKKHEISSLLFLSNESCLYTVSVKSKNVFLWYLQNFSEMIQFLNKNKLNDVHFSFY